MIGTNWKATLVTVLSMELTQVVERFTIMSAEHNGDLLKTIRPDLTKARDELTRILQTIQET